MKQIIDFLKNSKKIKLSNIIYVNLEIEYLKYDNAEKLDKHIQNRIKESESNDRFYIFVDEVQEIV
jgi:hypothetical protein